MQSSGNSNSTLDLETMIKRLSIFSNIDIAPKYNEEDEEDEDEEDEEEEESTENENINSDNEVEEEEQQNFVRNNLDGVAEEEESISQNEYEQTTNDEAPNRYDCENLDTLPPPLNIVIDENRYNSNVPILFKEISSNSNSNDEENYKAKLKKFENENQLLRKEVNDLKALVQTYSTMTTSNNEASLMSQIDSLKSENKSLVDDLNRLRAANSSYASQVDNLQKYEVMYKSKEFYEINNRLYQIVNKIGQGGFSEVFHCISFKDSKSFALKKVIINDEQNYNFVMNEIELLKRLQSTQKVIQLYDFEFIKSKKTLFLVMEMGSTDLNNFIKKEIQKNKCVTEPTRVYIWFKMLEAVRAIHQEGVIHSDLKPANFLLVGHEVKLIDFNISNSINDDRTSVTVMSDCGTLNYMPPESISRDEVNKAKVNQKSDVWSLGCILYLMVYGRLPFQHIKNAYQLMYTLVDPKKNIEFPSIHDKTLLDVLKKCLQHEQQLRYSVENLLSHDYIMSKQ